MSGGDNIDYWFLRENGLNAKTALRMLAIAYNVKERLEEAMREEEFHNDFHRTGGGGERQ